MGRNAFGFGLYLSEMIGLVMQQNYAYWTVTKKDKIKWRL